MTTLPPSPFTDSGAPVALTSEEAAAVQGSQPPAAAVGIAESSSSTGGCQGSPAPGQELCGAGDLDDLSNIGEIFVGARKLEQLPGIFDPAAITPADELLYVTLKAMDDHRTRDLPEIPAGLWAEFEPLPLFLQAAQ